MKRAPLVAALAAVACRGGEGPPPRPAELWKLAPAAATAGFVVDGPTLEAARVTVRLARDALANSAHPELATALTEMVSANDIQLLSDKSLRNAGIDLSRGAALFTAGDTAAGAVHIVDEHRFRKAVPGDVGTCDDRGALSLCARDAALLAAPGNGSSITELLRRAPPLSGGFELVHSIASGPIAVVADVSRGRVAVRARIATPALSAFSVPGPNPLASFVEAAPATAAVLIDVRAVAAAEASSAPAGSLIGVLRGDVVVVALAGERRVWFRAGVRDPARAAELLARCAPETLLGPIALVRDGDACAIVPDAVVGDPVHLRLDGDTLLGETQPGIASERGTPHPRIAAMLANPAALAAWGRGLGSAPPVPDELGATIKDYAPWVSAHIDEVGITVRLGAVLDVELEIGTVWQDSDAVLAELEPVLARTPADIGDALVALAARYPESRLAASVAADSVAVRALLAIIVNALPAAADDALGVTP